MRTYDGLLDVLARVIAGASYHVFLVTSDTEESLQIKYADLTLETTTPGMTTQAAVWGTPLVAESGAKSSLVPLVFAATAAPMSPITYHGFALFDTASPLSGPPASKVFEYVRFPVPQVVTNIGDAVIVSMDEALFGRP